VVPHRRPIRCGVIGPLDLERWLPPGGHAEHVGDEMRLGQVILTVEGGRPGGIEIAQAEDRGAVLARVVREQPLELALRLTVWVYRRQRRVLRDRRRAWMTIHGARRRKHDAPYARRGNALEEHPP